MQSLRDNQPSPRKREQHLSKDGKWRSFPKVSHLLQYVASGNYFGKVKIKGKKVRKSLQTTVWTTAQLRLNDFLKEQRENRNRVDAPKFCEAVEWFKQEIEHDTTTKQGSRTYRLMCIQKMQETWPGLWNLRLDAVTPQACREWAAGLKDQISGNYFNNIIGTLRLIIGVGLKAQKKNGGTAFENPAAELKRVREKAKDLQLPESSHFKLLVENMRKRSMIRGGHAANLIEFLAYGGMRIHSEAAWVTWEDVDWQRKQIVVRGNPKTGTKNSEIRRVPIIPDMERLLTRLKDKLGTAATGRIILQNSGCGRMLARACKEIGIAKLTHHDLRHLFATRCIESGVDIPTVSRWLGHKDGGALAMKTYGHLRNEHSQAMAQKVKF